MIRNFQWSVLALTWGGRWSNTVCRKCAQIIQSGKWHGTTKINLALRKGSPFVHSAIEKVDGILPMKIVSIEVNLDIKISK